MSTDGLAARIATELASEIVAGDVAVGTHMSTQGLAERFAVSRTPIRTALGILERQGFVRQARNRGYFVEAVPDRAKARAAPQTDAVTGRSEGPEAYFALAEDWLRDQVPEEVTENFLMERYQLSRSELAGVLTRASAVGWIERKPGYGWRLLPVAKTPEAQAQLYRLRLLLEPAAFLEPTFCLERDTIKRMRHDLERIRDGAHLKWPADRLHDIGVRFHEELMRMSGNPFLYQAVQRVNRMRRLLEYRSIIDRARVLQESTEHLEILEPLEAGDLVETSFRMRQHVGRALQRKQRSRPSIV